MSESEVEYEVEGIIDKRVEKKKTYYKVRWLGFNDNEATWEEASTLTNCEDLIRDFEKNGARPPFVVSKILEAKYDKDDKEFLYSCLNREQNVKTIPSHLLRIHKPQVLIEFLQKEVKDIEEHPPAKKASGKKKSTS